MNEKIDELNFLTRDDIKQIAETWGTPVFVYDEATLNQQANDALSFIAPYGLTVSYAMKANPNRTVLRIFDEAGIQMDTSSGYEAERALKAGIDPKNILITTQELPANLSNLITDGVRFDACSMQQLAAYGLEFPGSKVGIRINPGFGSGHSNKTNVGGPTSSFGIWHESIDEAKQIARKFELTIDRMHTHTGSGGDPKAWVKSAVLSLDLVTQFPDVITLNLGGGFKVARTQDEKNSGVAANLQEIGIAVSREIEAFHAKTGRKLQLEIEPGNYLVANAGSLVTTITDIVDTGINGYTFLKIDGGMTEILRPMLYAAQHPIIVIGNAADTHEYVVVGHTCESGDLMTPKPGDADAIAVRLLQKAAIGDQLIIEGVGAYCQYMSAYNYNSFPVSPAVLRNTDGTMIEISRRQTLDEMLALEY